MQWRVSILALVVYVHARLFKQVGDEIGAFASRARRMEWCFREHILLKIIVCKFQSLLDGNISSHASFKNCISMSMTSYHQVDIGVQ